MATSSTSISQVTNIGLQDFLKILTSQLSNQDPLKPLDNEAFVTQIAQFATLEQTGQLNQKIEQLLSVQSVTQSVGLLGKTIDVKTDAGATLSGTVSAIDYVSGSPQLTISTGSGVLQGVGLSQIMSVH